MTSVWRVSRALGLPSSEPATAAAASSASGALCPRVVSGCFTWFLKIHASSVLNFVHAFQHDHLAAFQTGSQSRVIAFCVLDRDWTQSRGVVFVNNPKEGPLRAPLNGGRGNDNGILQSVDEQSHIDELIRVKSV